MLLVLRIVDLGGVDLDAVRPRPARESLRLDERQRPLDASLRHLVARVARRSGAARLARWAPGHPRPVQTRAARRRRSSTSSRYTGRPARRRPRRRPSVSGTDSIWTVSPSCSSTRLSRRSLGECRSTGRLSRAAAIGLGALETRRLCLALGAGTTVRHQLRDAPGAAHARLRSTSRPCALSRVGARSGRRCSRRRSPGAGGRGWRGCPARGRSAPCACCPAPDAGSALPPAARSCCCVLSLRASAHANRLGQFHPSVPLLTSRMTRCGAAGIVQPVEGVHLVLWSDVRRVAQTRGSATARVDQRRVDHRAAALRGRRSAGSRSPAWPARRSGARRRRSRLKKSPTTWLT